MTGKYIKITSSVFIRKIFVRRLVYQASSNTKRMGEAQHYLTVLPFFIIVKIRNWKPKIFYNGLYIIFVLGILTLMQKIFLYSIVNKNLISHHFMIL